MSSEYEMDYFPPRGTKHKWNSRALNHRPVTALVKGICSQSATLYCDRDRRGYFGYMIFYSISGRRIQRRTRVYKKALSACLAIENKAQELFKADTKPWMRAAAAAGWRPT